MEAKKTEPQDEKEPEAEGSAKSYECQVCGCVEIADVFFS